MANENDKDEPQGLHMNAGPKVDITRFTESAQQSQLQPSLVIVTPE